MRADRLFMGCRVSGRGYVVGFSLHGLNAGQGKIKIEFQNGSFANYRPSEEVPVIGDPDLAGDPSASPGQPGQSKKRLILIGRLIQRDGNQCFFCGDQLMEPWLYTLDHLVPRSRGGKSILSNFVLACVACNHSKRDMTLAEYAQARPLADWRSRLPKGEIDRLMALEGAA